MNRFLLFIFFFPFVLSAQDKTISKQLNHIDSIKNDSLAIRSLELIAQNKKLTVQLQLELNRRIISRANALQKYDKAIAIGNKSLVMASKNKLDSLEAVFNKYLGISYYYMDQKRTSVPYFEKAIVLAQKNNLWELEANCNNNIGGALTDIQEYKLAEPYLLKSISMMKSHGNDNTPTTLNTYRVLARFYSESGKPEKAEELYLSLIKKSKEILDTALLSDNLLFYSEILTRRGEFDKAVNMSSEALELIRKRKKHHELQGALTIHALNLSKAGKYKEAYDLIEESKLLMRNTFSKDLEKQVSEVEVKYNTAQLKQEKEIAEIKAKEQQRIYLFSMAVLVILAGSGIYIWNQRKNNKQKIILAAELAEAEKQRFKEVIETEEKERSRIAQELHDGLGQLLSTARLNVAGLEDAVDEEDQPDLERSLKIIDEACMEIRHISHNMMPSALIRLGLIPAITELVHNINSAKGIKINFTTNLNTSLGTSIDITIYRVIQEILNNMIKHAKADLIIMNIEKKEANLAIMMKDNGIGFDTKELKKSKGMGWKNIFSRVSMLNGSIKLESELQKGTEIYINLKL